MAKWRGNNSSLPEGIGEEEFLVDIANRCQEYKGILAMLDSYSEKYPDVDLKFIRDTAMKYDLVFTRVFVKNKLLIPGKVKPFTSEHLDCLQSLFLLYVREDSITGWISSFDPEYPKEVRVRNTFRARGGWELLWRFMPISEADSFIIKSIDNHFELMKRLLDNVAKSGYSVRAGGYALACEHVRKKELKNGTTSKDS